MQGQANFERLGQVCAFALAIFMVSLGDVHHIQAAAAMHAAVADCCQQCFVLRVDVHSACGHRQVWLRLHGRNTQQASLSRLCLQGFRLARGAPIRTLCALEFAVGTAIHIPLIHAVKQHGIGEGVSLCVSLGVMSSALITCPTFQPLQPRVSLSLYVRAVPCA